MRFNMSFDEFKKEYIENLGGYLPTYISAVEEDNHNLMLVDVEMIAPFRMTDGPSRFFRVIRIPVTKEQYQELKEYAINAGEQWKADLIKNVEDCNFYSRIKY